VSFVCLVTIGLWCVEHQIEASVADMGIIAIIPIVAFFSTGVLKKDDFEHFLWTVVFLAMGGIALGKGVTSSGLLDVMDEIIRGIITDMSLYTVVLVLSGIVLVVSTLSAIRSRACCWFLSQRKSEKTFPGIMPIYSSS